MIGWLQRPLRAAFMFVEGLFNRAFGDKLNPFYHLGAIAFHLFWLVAASGLYLYAFFDTAVPGAYESVEAITHRQWWLGGIMRSVHRYASDGIVVVMLLHMLRHFAFDRIHGYRWFAWVTGVALIWFVYICGVNGFMLPWDRLAQFTVVATFEWIDWLPGFGGALMRNFIYADSVTDRFFSLLVFVHIGGPLLMLLLMWVHIQKVPKASTLPPRSIGLALLVALLALSVLLPVTSQGGVADLAVAVDTLQLDWFYLALYPLLYRWPLGTVWLLVAGLTALLFVLPWLRLAGGSRGERRIELHPGPHAATAHPGETLLDAGLRAGLALPYDCRNGGCGVCVCTVLQGRVDHGAYQPAALTESMRARGQTLLCCATALEDVVVAIDVASLDPDMAVAVRSMDARVESMERLSADVIRLMLALPPGERMPFVAGQYFNFILDDGQRRAFSFANPPHESGSADHPLIEVHVRLVEGGRFTTHVFTEMQVGDVLRIEGPFGRFVLHEGDRPILMIAGATGFAPIKSIVEDAFARGIQRPMQLYWGVRRRSDLYQIDLVERWAREHANFRFVPVLSDEPADGDWNGRRGLVHAALLEDHPDLSGSEVYVCGSVRMVEVAVPEFLSHGLGDDACFSDAFLPNPLASPSAADADRGATQGTP
ncbi:2Fe-2S iron-sulfur cluster-binding protein [Dokdonella sp.]|uniref:2Fe-2S iron-sulfur cluster-binding protein n=1 Tax=Dokdonella sp. TaxID=2291710 RepID=UPI0025C69454|nr:2Fe-2S iron-sulfur cluster-binding protein [Dokdonella sp.]MBX3691701.1 2Fe-2S iron-sulfur cluster binding domain-containing protein [Dokdonella sp.]MCW5567235.1 2Fe-2S iron-sulfur cluster binding domain-containing protein [Dokdonella sp.]